MSTQYKFFRIPTQPNEKDELELNEFLSSHKIHFVDRKFVNAGQHSFWSITVEYFSDQSENTASGKDKDDSRSRPDYKKLLTPEAFTLYLKLREWRKKIAEKESVALYAVFTNEHLAKIAENKINTSQGLQSIHGVGESKISKYSKEVFELVNSYQDSLKTNETNKKE